jgi:hypothetical protein
MLSSAGAASPILVYLAAPIGAPDAAGVEAQLGDVARWLRYFVELPDERCRRLSWQVPAYVYAAALEPTQLRERRKRDVLVALERCDALVLIGGETIEHELARATAMPISNLIGCGPLPPPTFDPNWWARGQHREVIRSLHAIIDAVDKRRAGARQATA